MTGRGHERETELRSPGLSRRSFLGATFGATFLGTAGGLLGRGELADASPLTPSSPHAAPTFPPVTITTPPAPRAAPGVVLLTPASTAYESGPMIIDSTGSVVWSQAVTAPGIATNLEVQTYLGQPVLTFWQGYLFLPQGFGAGQGVILDASFQQIATISAGNGLSEDLHELTISPQNTAFITAYHEHRHNLSSVGGPSNGKLLDSLFQEIDIATGAVLMQWRASRHVALSESYLPLPSSPKDPYDFFHINSIDVDDDGDLLVSARHTSCVYKVDRSSGAIIWRLGGKKSDFVMGKGARFQFQHHARHHPGNILTVFDDGKTPHDKLSRGLDLSLKMKEKRVELRRAYPHHPKLYSGNQGSVQLLANRNVFIGWGGAPYFSEYTPDGQLVFEGRFPDGVNSYRAFKASWPPATG